MAGYDTNLAAEYYILSCLHRLGLAANLTLANNLVTKNPRSHFVALVSFEGRIEDVEMPPPRVWIVPFGEVERFKRFYQGRTNVSRAAVVAEGRQFENAWGLIGGTAENEAQPTRSNEPRKAAGSAGS